MTTKDEALKQAKQATAHKVLIDELLSSITPKTEREHAAAREIEKLREALTQQDSEPVAWITPDGEGFRIRFSPPVNDLPLGWDALYTTPQPAPAVQQGWMRVIDEEMVGAHLGIADASDTYEQAKKKLNDLIAWHTSVATDPAVNGGFELKPAVQPLTDEQIYELDWPADVGGFTEVEFIVRQVEAAHGIGAPKEPQRDTTDPDIQTIMLQAEVKE